MILASSNTLIDKNVQSVQYIPKKETPVDITSVDFSFGKAGGTMTDLTGAYGGTDITGAAGGNLLKGVYSDADRMKIMNYYKNMNIIGSN